MLLLLLVLLLAPGAPWPPPKPVEQVPPVAAETVIEVAATVPVSSVLPCAVTHLPTASADFVALTSAVYLVAELTVTVLIVDFSVCASVVLIVIVSPLTAVTSPVVGAAKPPPDVPVPVAPDGTPVGIPLGRGADVAPDPLAAPALPAARAPKPEAQLPSTAAVTRTVVIAEEEDDDEDEDVEDDALGVADAVMHEPTLTAASVALAFCVKVVLAL